MAAGEGEMKDQLQNDDYLNDLIKRYCNRADFEVVPPDWLYQHCQLEESGPEDNPTWKSKELDGGTRWMIGVIWRNLSNEERWQISMMSYGIEQFEFDLERWLHIQLIHNWSDCFTNKSKERSLGWMVRPRDVTY
mgnify:CR=1 FL=1|tara:strand:+ start:149 stop:553 length:405 start_codon:yes stop_codon:yes gene_type:complete